MNELAEPGGWFVRILSGWFMPRAATLLRAAQIRMKQRDVQLMLLPIDEIPILKPPNLKKKGKRL